MQREPDFNNARLQQLVERSARATVYGAHHVFLNKAVRVLKELCGATDQIEYGNICLGYECFCTYDIDWYDEQAQTDMLPCLQDFMGAERSQRVVDELKLALKLIQGARLMFRKMVFPALQALLIAHSLTEEQCDELIKQGLDGMKAEVKEHLQEKLKRMLTEHAEKPHEQS